MGDIDRYTRQDLNSMLYNALEPIKETIGLSGDIYIDNERPNNSVFEDIVINTPSLSYELMQTGYSNINIYVPHETIQDDGGYRYVYNPRTDEIIKEVYDLLSSFLCNGSIRIDSENEVGSAERDEHFINMRIYWKILKR